MSTAHARPGPGTAGHGEALETDRADAVRREGTARSSSGPMALLALQRSAGNRVASAYVQRQRAAPPAPTVSPAGPVPQGDVATATPETETVEASETERAARSVALTAAVPPPDPPRTGSAAPVQRGWLGDLGSAVGSAVGGAVRAVGNVAGAVRDRVLQSVTGMARRIPGYELLCVVLGRDVVTGTAVARTSAALIGGFLGLIPGSDRIRQNLQESGAIERAGQWLDAEVPRLGLNFDTIRGLFRAAWDALSPTDLLDPAGAFRRIAGIFVPPLARLRDFALAAGKKMLEFVFEGVLSLAGGLGSRVMGIIRRASGVFDQIMANPVGFAGNLIAAVRGGLGAFLTNVATHLRNGLIGWLTGSLGGIIRIPAQFNLRGILGMAMDFLGITWDRVKGKLARLIGERAVSLLERGAGIVHAIYERGLSAITDRISEFTSGIVDTVLGGIREWVTNSVVGAAITRLISMFNPAGAVIQAIIAVYNTVQFFIERAQQLGALASAVFDSIAAIASGGVGGAIRYVEQALGRAVPVVLGFLARLIGLGDVAAPVRGVMQRVQTVIDGAIDRVVGWIAGLARRAGSALRGGSARPAAGTPAPGRVPAEGTVLGSTATTAAGHSYQGRAVVHQGSVRLLVQRAFVPALPAARLSAGNAALPAQEQLNRLVRSIQGFEQRGVPTDPERVARLNTLLGQVIQQDLAAAATAAGGAPTGALANHVTEFGTLTAPGARRNAYYMTHVSWPTLTRSIRARDLSRIEAAVRDLGQHWVNGETAVEEFLESLYDEIRLGMEGPGDERIGGMPKYVPRGAIDTFRPIAAGFRTSDRAARSVDVAGRRSALNTFLASIRAGSFDVDHRESLARHWNATGHNSTAEVRARIASDPGNLVLVSASWNRSKSGEGENYAAQPAVGFTRNLGETVPTAPPAGGATGGAPAGGILAPSP
jgi:hypothetical protein